jgi:hypothetical protein
MIHRMALSTTTAVILFLAGVLLFAGCVSTSPFVITGTSLAVAGDQFAAVGALYKQGCDVTKSLAANQCNAWRAFGLKFQQMYPITVQAWKAARATNDSALMKQTDALVTTLMTELGSLASVVGVQLTGR